MENQNLVEMVDAINHISLNQKDLMDAVLKFSKNYNKNNPKDELLLDRFFSNSVFLEQSIITARESIVVAMCAITLEEKIDFNIVVENCINIEWQKFAEKEVCLDEDAILLMNTFLSELRKELFSQLYSRNKDFQNITKISKTILKNRYEYFMSKSF